MQLKRSPGHGQKARQRAAALAVSALCGAGCFPVHAALVDRGSGMIYDTVLDITWLADANHAKTSGYDADGRMNWADANAWAATLVYGGFSDWRLPTLGPVGSSFGSGFTNNASTEDGYARTTTNGNDGGWRDARGAPVSEMGHMYYVNLANHGLCAPDDANPGSCSVPLSNVGFSDDPANPNDENLFVNLQSFPYWSGTAFQADPTLDAWFFSTLTGRQAHGFQRNEYYAWAVRDGDVLPVPAPATLCLVALGLAALTRPRILSGGRRA